MKNHIVYSVKMKKISCLLIVLPFYLFIGCTKEKTDRVEEVGIEDGTTAILVSVGGIEEDGVILNAKASLNTNTGSSPTVGEVLSHEEGFDSRISTGEFVHTPVNIIKVNNYVTGNSDLVRAAKMEDNIIYHLMIYRAVDNVIVWNKQMKSAEQIKIKADAGVNYKWIAYSYNTELGTDLPAISALSSPNIAMGQNKDFLYASGDITPNPLVITPLRIVFSHKTARIAVELNTLGMFANLNSADIAIDNQLKTRNFNVIEGTSNGNQTVVASASTTSFIRYPGYTYDDRKVAYFYTTDFTEIPTLTVKLKSFTIGLDAHAVAQGQSTRVFSGLTSTFSTSKFIPEEAKSKLFRIDLIESPVTTTNNATALSGTTCCAITTKWARANLYYVEGHNPYRFHHLNQQTSDANTYFAVGSSVPRKFASSSSMGDPCELVYPAGIWRTANTYDYNSIAGGGTEGLPISLGYRAKTATRAANSHIEYPVDNTAVPQYPNNTLRFNYNGSGVAVALILELVELRLTNIANTASIWTNSKTLDLGLLNLGHNYYYANAGNHGVLSEPLKLDLLGGLNLVNSGFRNLRCVRK